MHYRFNMFDIYEWTMDNPPTIGNKLHPFHELGYAKQYLMAGAFEGVITWQEGETAYDIDVFTQITNRMKDIEGTPRWIISEQTEDYLFEATTKYLNYKQKLENDGEYFHFP